MTFRNTLNVCCLVLPVNLCHLVEWLYLRLVTGGTVCPVSSSKIIVSGMLLFS